MDNGQSELSFEHIISRWLAYFLGVIIIEDVIANLENNTDESAEFPSCFYIFFGSTNRNGPNNCTRLKKSSRLLPYHLVIYIF